MLTNYCQQRITQFIHESPKLTSYYVNINKHAHCTSTTNILSTKCWDAPNS